MPDKSQNPPSSPLPPPPTRRHIPFLPGTRLGWWALGLAVVTLLLPLLTVLVNLILNLGTSAEPRGIAIPGALIAVVAIASGILGLVAVLGKKERGLLAWLPIFFGFFFFFLVIFDLISAL